MWTSPRRLAAAGVVAGALAATVLSAQPWAAADPTPAPDPAPSSTPTTGTDQGGGLPDVDHVVVVVMENKDRKEIVGSGKAAYINQLAAEGVNLTQSYAVTHPSQPNYVASFWGDTLGVDSSKCEMHGGPNLGTQLLDAGKSFKWYSENLPGTGSRACEADHGLYRRKHNAAASSSQLPASANVPFSQFPSDYNQLPTLSYVTPNMCNDMHDCGVGTGDRWLKSRLGGYAEWAKTHNSLLVVTFDENGGGTVNHIATVIVGQPVKPGNNAERVNHYGMLRTFENLYGLEPLRHAKDQSGLTTIWADTNTDTNSDSGDGGEADPSPTPSADPAASPSPTPSPTNSTDNPTPTPAPSTSTVPTEGDGPEDQGDKGLSGGSPNEDPNTESYSDERDDARRQSKAKENSPAAPIVPRSPNTPKPPVVKVPKPDLRLTAGGFEESGRWIYSGTSTTSTSARSGSSALVLGSPDATVGNSTATQQFTVPSGKHRLTVYLRGACADNVKSAWTVVELKAAGSTFAPIMDRRCDQTATWRRVTATVKPGKTYTLRLVNHDDGNWATPNLTYFDDITLR